MWSKNPAGSRRPQTEPMPLGQAGESLWRDLEEWDASGPSPLWEDLWDAFESDDEMAEPQPEYGDFWGEPDDPPEI